MKTYLLLFFWFCVSILSFGQNKFVANNDIFGKRVFIKNNGQFDAILPKGKVVDFAYSNGDEQVYFNKNGVTYLLQKQYPMTHSQMEALEHGEKLKVKPSKKAFVDVNWENSNPNIEIVVGDKQSYYQSYGDEKLKSDCYKKITYKNVYNNIDIEYVFTTERNNGIKYNIIVHPGGNPDDIKIKYSGDINKVILKNDNVIIKTNVSNITELAPTSYQDGHIVTSYFKVTNNTIFFELPNFYDKTKDLSIDPWVVNLALANNNYGYDVDYDFAGNYFVYGGSGPFLISKYSPTGVLLWTFNGIVSSIGWTSSGSYTPPIPGNFILDKVSGKVYTGQGFNDNGTRIIRLNFLGIYDNFISEVNYYWNEVFDMGYNCGNGTIFGLGGSTASSDSAGILNTTSGTLTPQNFTGFIGPIGQDVACSAIDSNGTVFLLFSSATTSIDLNNKLMKVNNSFTSNVWIAPTNFDTLLECQNKIYPGANLSTYSSNGFNALAVNNSYLYFYDGYNLAVYNKVTGISIAATTLTGQTVRHQGGIAVDECNNIYVGGNGFIKCFHFNGTTFTPNGSIPVASTTTLQYVTDLKLNSSTNELYVCGSGFGGIYAAINSGTCSNATLGVTQTLIGTNNTTAVATVTTAVVAPIISYTWLNSSNVIISQTNNSTAITNTVTNLVNGTYTLLAQINAPCGFTTSQTFIVSAAATITPIFTQVSAICSGSFLAALPTTSNNVITGNWSPAINNTATTLYTFTPNVGQSATTAIMTIVVNPIITPTFTQVLPICSGTILSNLQTTSNNSISGNWSPVMNNTATTLYTFTPTIGQCATTATMTIVVNPNIAPTFTQVLPICSGTILANLTTTSNNSISGNWSPVMNNTATTLYTFTPTIGQCAIPAQMTIVVNPIRVPTFAQIPAICYNGIVPTLPLTDSNGILGTWQPSIISATSSGNYLFTPTSGQCTLSNFVMPITVFEDFDFEIKQACVGNDFVLQVAALSNSFDVNNANYFWENSTNINVGSNSATFNITNYNNLNSITPQFPLLFSVDVLLPNGCKKTQTISLKSIFCTIQKGISPNADSKNDFFDLQLLNVKMLSIFNRYGVKVYSQPNYTNQWIGQSNSGQELPDGTYYYVIDFDNDRPTTVGWIYINREN